MKLNQNHDQLARLKHIVEIQVEPKQNFSVAQSLWLNMCRPRAVYQSMIETNRLFT
jgi:hypothetical protein